MYKNVLIDLDDTILDFKATERAGVSKAFQDCGLTVTDALLAQYSQINAHLWERFDLGEISRSQILYTRFALLFQEIGFDFPPEQCEAYYRHYLGIGHYFVDGAEVFLDYLSGKYRLYLVSNGFADTQYPRLESANLNHYFAEIFISETIGYHKPDPKYFAYCFDRIPNFRKEETIIIGDSLTSDILGGIQAGIHSCWFNHRQKPPRPEICPTFTIYHLSEIQNIL